MKTHKKTDYITDIALAAYEELTSLYGNGPAMSAAILVLHKLPAEQRESAVKFAKGESDTLDLNFEPAENQIDKRLDRRFSRIIGRIETDPEMNRKEKADILRIARALKKFAKDM